MENLRCVFEIIVALGALGGFIACFPIVRNWFRKAGLASIKIDEDIIIAPRGGTLLICKIAFLSKNKKAIIAKIEAKLKHDKGAERTLLWKYMEEYFGELDFIGIGIGTQKNTKFQRSLALIAYTDYFVEKSFWLYDDTFSFKENDLKQKIREKLVYLSRVGKNTQEIKTENEYLNLIDNYKNSFYWAEGKYTMDVIVTLESKKTFTVKMEFNLTSTDLLLLNAEHVETYTKRIEQEFVDADIEIKNLRSNSVAITAKIINK